MGVLEVHFEHGAGRWIHGGFPELFGVHFAEALVALDADVVAADLVELGVHFVIAVGVPVLLPLSDEVEGGLGDVDAAVFNEGLHVAVEEGEEEGADVSTVDVGIRHDDDFAVAALGEVEVVGDAAAKRGDHGADLGVREDLVEARFFDV